MKRTILLADDSLTIQRLVERTFEGSDFIVEAVSNGEAALHALGQQTPAAVLADIYMPGKNGYEVCAHVRKDSALSATPVVLLVGAFEAFDESEARRVGADRWITKPFEPKQLMATVAELVRDAEAVSGRSPERETSGSAAVSADMATAAPSAVVVNEAAAGRIDGPDETAPLPESPDTAAVFSPAGSAEASGSDEEPDLLGLEELFPQPSTMDRRTLSEEEVEAIADRVIDRLSTDVVESIAWDIVPEIADRVMRDELKNRD